MVTYIIVGVGTAFLLVQLIAAVGSIREVSARCGQWRDLCYQDEYRRLARGQAVLDLERSLANAPYASTLRRLGVMAPLLGVVLTTGALMFSPPVELERVLSPMSAQVSPSSTASDQPAMPGVTRMIAPLLAGVFVGAVLAIINQFLVAVQHWHEDRAFRAALDSVPLKSFRDTDDAVEQMIESLRSAGVVLASAVESVGALASRVRASMEEVSRAGTQAHDQLSSVAGHLQAAVAAPAREFSAAAERMRKAAEDCAGRLQQATDAMGSHMGRIEARVEATAGIQQRHFEEHAKVSQRLASATDTVAEAARALAATRVTQLAEHFESSASAARAMAGELGKSVQSVAGATQAMGAASQQMTSAIAASQEALERVRREADALSSVVQSTGRTISAVPQESGRMQEQLALSTQALAKFTQGLERALADLKSSGANRSGLGGLFRARNP